VSVGVAEVTHILLVAPLTEQVVHNIPIHDNSDVRKVQAFIQDKTKDYGEITRILFSLGTVRILDPRDEIPIPLQSAPGGKGR